MLAARTRWSVAQVGADQIERLKRELGLTSLVAKVVAARGWTPDEVRQILAVADGRFPDPYLMLGMEEAVRRLKQAASRGEKIRIYGDYDCDGITGTTILMKTLAQLGASVDYYIPDRLEEGYGLNRAAIDQAVADGIQLLVTVDTGITGKAEIDYALERGVEVIVTDHHQPPPELPQCVAVLNPKQPGCSYPFKELAGVGIAWKVAQALLDRIPWEYIDLAALGTISDMVPLVGENRLLAWHGLKRMSQTSHLGLRVLIEECGLGQGQVNEEHVGYILGPRLNSMGRLATADRAVQLLLTADRQTALDLVREMEALNQERQRLVQQMVQEAKAQLESQRGAKALVVAQEGWHEGVLGIVAARLVEEYYLPSVVLSIDQETGQAKGSARSIAGFNIYQALSYCQEWLNQFGGHQMAAGLSLDRHHIAFLRTRLDQLAEQWLSSADFQPATRVDAVCSTDELTVEAIEQLAALAPFGEGNPRPTLLLEKVRIEALRQVGAEGDHLKAVFRQGETPLEAIGFGWGGQLSEISPAARVNLVGEAAINEWNGHKKPQLVITDLSITERQYFDWRNSKDLTENLQGVLGEGKVLLAHFRSEPPPRLSSGLTPLYVFPDGQPEQEELLAEENGRVILYDLPQCEEQLLKFSTFLKGAGRIYILFRHGESHYFTPVPSREHFKWYYAFLLKNSPFNLTAWGPRLAQKKGWTMEMLRFMTDVFIELNFVREEQGEIIVEPNPTKQPLTASKRYRLKQEELRLEQTLIYSPLEEVVQLMESYIGSDGAEPSRFAPHSF